MQTRFLGVTVALGLSVAAWSCGSSGGMRLPQVQPQRTEPAAADPVHAALEGEWRLVAMETAEGPRRVTGFLRYDRFSNLTMRAELAADDPAARAPQTVVAAFTAKASPSAGAFDYAGLTEEVGRERLMPDAVDMREWRHFQVDGQTLRVMARGGRSATLVFQRAQ